MDNKELLYCAKCQDKEWFDIEGNIKICSKCWVKSSYRAALRKRWVYAKSHPDSTAVSPYNNPCDQNTKEKFEEVQERLYLLSAREREVVELLWEGKTHEEVATILGVGRQRVTACLNRARAKLVVAKPPTTGR